MVLDIMVIFLSPQDPMKSPHGLNRRMARGWGLETKSTDQLVNVLCDPK